MKTEGPRWTGDWGLGPAMVVSWLAAAGQQDLASSGLIRQDPENLRISSSWAKGGGFLRTRRRAPSSASETANSLCPQSMEAVASCGGESIAEDAKATQRCALRQCCGKQMSGALLLADGMEAAWTRLPASSWDLPLMQGEQ